MKNHRFVHVTGVLLLCAALGLSLSSCRKQTEEAAPEKSEEPAVSGDGALQPETDSLAPEPPGEAVPDTLEESFAAPPAPEGDTLAVPEYGGDSIALSGPEQLLSFTAESGEPGFGALSPGAVEPPRVPQTWPEAMPGEFPEFTDGKIVTVQTTDTPGMTMWSMTFEEVPDRVVGKYDEALKAKGFQTMATINTIDGREVGSITARKGKLYLAFMVGEGTANLSANQSK